MPISQLCETSKTKSSESCPNNPEKNAIYWIKQHPNVSNPLKQIINKTIPEFIYIHSNSEQRDWYNRHKKFFFISEKTLYLRKAEGWNPSPSAHAVTRKAHFLLAPGQIPFIKGICSSFPWKRTQPLKEFWLYLGSFTRRI